jgi:hypothetical protein
MDRLPPNGCKVLFDWGLETEIRENAVVGEGFMIYNCKYRFIRLHLRIELKEAQMIPKGRSLAGITSVSHRRFASDRQLININLSIGLNLWDPELLVEARGDFLQMRVRIPFYLQRNGSGNFLSA